MSINEPSTTTTSSSSRRLIPQVSEFVHVHESTEKLLLAAQLPKAATSVSPGRREKERDEPGGMIAWSIGEMIG